MTNWFSEYNGNWTRAHGYNSLFALQVRLIRDWFKLQRVSPGNEQHTGRAKRYRFRDHNCGGYGHSAWSGDYACSVLVREFKWDEVGEVNGRQSPIFRLELTVYREGKVLFQGPLVIEFNPEFPQKPPYFRVDKPEYQHSSRSEHLHARGIMCIMGGGYNGYRESQWDPRVDTVITALNRALELLVWHVVKFGW